MVVAKGEKAYAKATEVCEKQDKKWTALPNPPGSTAEQFRFECLNSYDIVPLGGDTYRIWVFTADIPVRHVTVPATRDKPADTQWGLDTEPADREVAKRASDYCAKTSKTMEIASRTFEPGTGLKIVFKCGL
jgi:hypothetical protein